MGDAQSLYGHLSSNYAQLSMKEKYSFVFCTCDSYSDLWEPFFTLLQRYWPNFDYDVYFCTESTRFSFPGFKIHCHLNEPQSSTWSQRLIDLLHIIPTENIIFMLDDFWIKEPVNTKRLHDLMERFDADKQMGHINLIHESASALQPSTQYPDLVMYPKRRPYRITTQASLYRKDYLLQILRAHESAWQFEVYGSKRSARLPQNPYIIANGSEPIFSYDHGGVIRRGNFIKEYVDHFIKDEGIVINSDRPIKPEEVILYEYHKNHKRSLRGLIDKIRSLLS